MLALSFVILVLLGIAVIWYFIERDESYEEKERREFEEYWREQEDKFQGDEDGNGNS